MKRVLSRADLLIHIAFSLSMINFWRDFSFSVFPGDLGDTRVSMLWMENWYQALNSFGAADKVVNLPIFFPLTNTLSGSDAFFMQGLTHSLLRLMGFPMEQAFMLAIFMLHALGSYSCVKLLKFLRAPFFVSIFVVSTYGVMTPFWLSRNHVQLLMFTFLGWIAYFFMKYISEKKAHHLVVGVAILLSLALSCGYAIIFGISLVAISALCLFLFDAKKFLLSVKSGLLSIRDLLTVFIFNIPLLYFISKIYFSQTSILSSHSKSEILFYSPTLMDFLDVPRDVANFESNIYILEKIGTAIASLPNPTGEFGGSFGIITVSIVLICALFLLQILFKKYKGGLDRTECLILIFALLIIAILFLIVKDGRGFNLWSITFGNMPIFSGIRVLTRFTLVMSLLLSFFLGYSLYYISTLKIGTWSLSGKLIASILALAVVVNQPVNFYGSFSVGELKVLSRLDPLLKQNCSSFYLRPDYSQLSKLEPWVVSGDALLLATRSGIPTINGASSFFPSNYPPNLFFFVNPKENTQALKGWLLSNELKSTCLVTYVRNLENPQDSKLVSFEIFVAD